MTGRTDKIFALLKNDDRRLLHLPKYESTKGTTVEEQEVALKNKFLFRMINNLNINRKREISQAGKSRLQTQITDKISCPLLDLEQSAKKKPKSEYNEKLHVYELTMDDMYEAAPMPIIIRNIEKENQQKHEKIKLQLVKEENEMYSEILSHDTDFGSQGELFWSSGKRRNKRNEELHVYELTMDDVYKVTLTPTKAVRHGMQENEKQEQIKLHLKSKESKIYPETLPHYTDFESEDELIQSSGSEYIPDSCDEVSDEDSSEISGLILRDNKIFSGILEDSSMLSTSSKESGNQDANLPPSRNVDGVIVSYGTFLQPSFSNVEQFTNCRPWTKKSACPYCFKDITHFPRHLRRNHKEEGAVRELLTLSVKDPKRKKLLDAIRRQGNYASTSSTNIVRPVRRPKVQDSTESIENMENGKEKYVVCQDCLGYFKRNYLRRHRKRCASRPKSELDTRSQHLSATQLFTVCSGSHNDFYSTLRLKNEIFPIMRNDEISKLAMNDILICCYAESLLKKHKRTQIRNVISNKMRELGRFLLILKNVTGLKQLFDILKPQFFDNCVSATKIISGYDEQTHTFKAGSLALHMGTTLKQVCDVATKMIIKKSQYFPCPEPEEALKDIKRLKNLIENHWNWEVSSLALKNLNEKRYQKPKLLPLTQDVMQFQKFVHKEAKNACSALKECRELKKNYRLLSECTLALTLLLNRKRIGEIQYLKSKTYYQTIPQNQQEEFLKSLSDAERILTRKFKRIVTEGKGSKPVAIMFSTDVQEFIELLYDARKLCVPDTNEYLFANPSTPNGWLSGYHTLKKLAESSGVSNVNLFTSTRLRKQIATVLQVINITENEMEQFANFMGHTKKTHESYYRLPQDLYQTAKVSKLLIAINSGKASSYKGKTLDEIELSDMDDSDSEHNDIECLQNPSNVNCLSSTSELQLCPDDLEVNVNHRKSNNSIGEIKNEKIKRVKWTEEQKEVIKRRFKKHIKNKIAPRKFEVEGLIREYGELFKNKNWVTIKAFVYNCYK